MTKKPLVMTVPEAVPRAIRKETPAISGLSKTTASAVGNWMPWIQIICAGPSRHISKLSLNRLHGNGATKLTKPSKRACAPFSVSGARHDGGSRIPGHLLPEPESGKDDRRTSDAACAEGQNPPDHSTEERRAAVAQAC